MPHGSQHTKRIKVFLNDGMGFCNLVDDYCVGRVKKDRRIRFKFYTGAEVEVALN